MRHFNFICDCIAASDNSETLLLETKRIRPLADCASDRVCSGTSVRSLRLQTLCPYSHIAIHVRSFDNLSLITWYRVGGTSMGALSMETIHVHAW